MGVHVGGLGVVPLLAATAGCHCWACWAAIAGCHCWAAIAGDGGLDVVPLLAAIAGLPLLGAIAGLPLGIGGGGWVHTLVRIGRGAVAGCHCWAAIAGCHARVAPLWGQWLDAIARCHCRMLATNSSGFHVGCHCWAPLLGPIAWVPLFGAIAGCHCWCAIAGLPLGIGGEGGCTRWRIGRGAIGGCHARVPLPGCQGAIVGAMAGCHCSVPLPDAIATGSSGVHVGCHCWAPLLGPIAWVPLFGAIAGCHCLLGAIVGCHGWMPLLVPLLRAIARNHREKKLTRVLHRSPLPFSLH